MRDGASSARRSRWPTARASFAATSWMRAAVAALTHGIGFRSLAAGQVTSFWGKTVPFDGESDYLSLAEAAEMFGVSVRTLERWTRDGRIPSEVFEDGRRILRRADVAERVVRLRRAPRPEGRERAP